MTNHVLTLYVSYQLTLYVHVSNKSYDIIWWDAIFYPVYGAYWTRCGLSGFPAKVMLSFTFVRLPVCLTVSSIAERTYEPICV